MRLLVTNISYILANYSTYRGQYGFNPALDRWENTSFSGVNDCVQTMANMVSIQHWTDGRIPHSLELMTVFR